MEYRGNRNAVCVSHDRETACSGQVLAMAYVPVQVLTSVYEPEAGYPRGTIFPDLDKPFTRGRCRACG